MLAAMKARTGTARRLCRQVTWMAAHHQTFVVSTT
jgi:hypothetical protein